MDVIGTVEVVLIAFGLVLVASVCWLWLRRRWLSRAGGTFSCSLRRPGVRSPRWVLGVARYRDNEVQWFPSFSLSLVPRRRLRRADVRIGEQRVPGTDEAFDLLDDQRILTVQGPEGATELAMAPDSLTGLLSWLEASPPGGRYWISPVSPE